MSHYIKFELFGYSFLKKVFRILFVDIIMENSFMKTILHFLFFWDGTFVNKLMAFL